MTKKERDRWREREKEKERHGEGGRERKRAIGDEGTKGNKNNTHIKRMVKGNKKMAMKSEDVKARVSRASSHMCVHALCYRS